MESNMRAAILGVSGFIGRGLPPLLAQRGMASTGISRHPKQDFAGVDRWQTPDSLDFSGHRAVINLAGEPIDQRWNEESRRRIHDSRVGLTVQVVEAMAKLPEHERPKVLVNGSAVGLYGDRGDDVLTEISRPGDGYLADLCSDWEHAAKDAETLGVRVVLVRTGIVLGNEGGAFAKMRPIFKLGLGGPFGHGVQWMPWIHLDDLRAAIVHAVFSETLSGPINGSAPNPERNSDFSRKLAKAVHRPAFLAVPPFALKLALGEFGGSLLESQRAIPTALEADGFSFRHPTLEGALAALV